MPAAHAASAHGLAGLAHWAASRHSTHASAAGSQKGVAPPQGEASNRPSGPQTSSVSPLHAFVPGMQSWHTPPLHVPVSPATRHADPSGTSVVAHAWSRHATARHGFMPGVTHWLVSKQPTHFGSAGLQ